MRRQFFLLFNRNDVIVKGLSAVEACDLAGNSKLLRDESTEFLCSLLAHSLTVEHGDVGCACHSSDKLLCTAEAIVGYACDLSFNKSEVLSLGDAEAVDLRVSYRMSYALKC